jgi:DNA-binding CsgD family transcriptional regulator
MTWVEIFGDVAFYMSPMEKRVARAMITTHTAKGIAELLGLSIHTTNKYIQRVIYCTGMSSRTQFMVVVIKHLVKDRRLTSKFTDEVLGCS